MNRINRQQAQALAHFAAATAVAQSAVLVTGDPEFKPLEGLFSIDWLPSAKKISSRTALKKTVDFEKDVVSPIDDNRQKR